MRIGLAGRIGAGIILFAVVADATTWLVRAFDNYPFGFYELSDAYLPFVFLFGLALLLPSLSIAVQTTRAANLARFPLTTVGPLPRQLWRDNGQEELGAFTLRQSPAPGNEVPPPTLAFVPSHLHLRIVKKLGYACLLAAVTVYGGTRWWMATRNYYPLDAPIALAKGPNRTANFRINIQAVYLLRLELRNDYDPSCRLWEGAAPRIHWRLLRSESPVAEGSFDRSDWYRADVLGRFELARGFYRLEVDSPGNCAIGAYLLPRLKVEVDRESIGVDSEMYSLTLALVALGTLLLFWPHVREMQGMSLGVEPGTIRAGVVEPVHKTWTSAARPKLLLHHPAAACAAGSILAFVLPVFMLLTIYTPQGLMVHVPQPGTYARADEPWNEPLVVRVDAGENLYLNRQPIPPSGLEKRLRDVLSLRADWRVYVDGDPDAAVGDIIWVVDTLRGMGIGKVLLVTPSMKKEKPAFFVTPPCEIRLIKYTELPFPPQRDRYGTYRPLVSFVVSERGDISNVKILESSGDAGIDKWALNSVLRWRYTSKPGCGSRVLEKQLSAYYYGDRY